MQDLNIAFIGAGNMAFSLIKGLLNAGVPPAQLHASDPVAAQLERLEALGVHTATDNDAVSRGADVVLLAVKPQVLGAVLTPLALHREQLLVSIAAGVPVASLARWTAADQPIVRCMPNTPALLGAGVTAMFANAAVSAAQRDTAMALLGAAGKALWVSDEALLDAVTAVSGSGPAYFFYLMEAMIAAGTALGLDAETATELTLETAYGAALMARQRTSSPAALRVAVTSPGGTTERALSILDAAGTRATIATALTGAAQRAQELAEEFGQS